MRNHFRHLRDCFGCFTTGVTVATTIAQNGKNIGVTINSFSSVSLDPALVLFSLDNASASLASFTDARYFALNILAENQSDISRNFALSSHPDKWEGVDFTPGSKTGSPLLSGIIAYLECEKERVQLAGDHSIFIGRVLACDRLSENNPLVYYKGSYRAIGTLL